MSLAEITVYSVMQKKIINVAPNDDVLKAINEKWQNLANVFYTKMVEDASW